MLNSISKTYYVFNKNLEIKRIFCQHLLRKKLSKDMCLIDKKCLTFLF